MLSRFLLVTISCASLAGCPTWDGSGSVHATGAAAFSSRDDDPAGSRPDITSTTLTLVIDAADGALARVCTPIVVTVFDARGYELRPDPGLAIQIQTSAGTLHSSASCNDGIAVETDDVADAPGSGRTGSTAYLMTPDNGPVTITASAINATPAEHGMSIWQTTYGPHDLASRTLVVFNENHPDAETIADYYAAARSIPESQLCAVAVPTGGYAHVNDLLGARGTIVEDCICPALDPAIRPQPCDLSSLDAIAQVSPFTHMVLVRGMPLRLQGTAWPGDFEDPSFGYYLSYLIYRDVDIFSSGSGSLSPGYSLYGAFDKLIEPLDAAEHRYLAYGTLQAMTAERTMALIDRTLAAEQAGFGGNVLSESHMPDLRLLVGSVEPDCYEYLTHTPFVFQAPESSWPFELCRYGTTQTSVPGAASREIPGEPNTTVPFPVGVGMFFGDNPWPQGHNAFDGFSVMRRWHRTEAVCTELCRDFPTAGEVLACQERSLDYFREINTDCVGAARGFVGHQVRSYPVMFYGFLPPGWAQHWGGSGDFVPPTILETGGFQNARFSDTAYAHFGTFDVNHPDTSTCRYEDGSIHACPEAIRVNMAHHVDLPVPLVVSGSRSFQVKARHRNQGGASSVLQLVLKLEDGGGSWHEYIGEVDLSESRSVWTEASVTFTVPESEATTIQSFYLFLYGGWQIRGFLDLDGLEVIDLQTGDQLVGVEAGSFDAWDHELTEGGDYAANVIDRLGGVAWFGSSSHFLFGGWSWSNDLEIAGTWFAGRTLGEALVHPKAAAGLFFGDPLYRPAAVKLYAADGSAIGKLGNQLHVWLDWPAPLTEVRVNAMLGTSSLRDVRWQIDVCDGFDVATCDAWTPLYSAQGAARDVSVPWMALLDPSEEREITLRLTVVRPEIPEEPLFAYAYFNVHPGAFITCLGDVNRDLEVDEVDYELVRNHRQCTPESLALANFDGDDVDIDDDDYAIFKQYVGQQDPRADLNRDGSIDYADEEMFHTLRCGLTPGPEDDFDLDDDGDIDDSDLGIVEENSGSCLGG